MSFHKPKVLCCIHPLSIPICPADQFRC